MWTIANRHAPDWSLDLMTLSRLETMLQKLLGLGIAAMLGLGIAGGDTVFVTLVAMLTTACMLLLPWLSERDESYCDGKLLDPKGGPRWKNILATGMALIAQFKERKKFSACSNAVHEQFHKQENHAYWNESYYYNASCPVRQSIFAL